MIALRALLAALVAGSSSAGPLYLESNPTIESRACGYQITRPADHSGARQQRENGSETIVVWPKGENPRFEEMADLKRIAHRRMIVLNVFPFSRFPAIRSIDKNVENNLKRAKSSYTRSTIDSPLGSAALFDVKAPSKHVKIVLVGRNAAYELLAGALDQPLRKMLGSLSESTPDPKASESARGVAQLGERLDREERLRRERATGRSVGRRARSTEGFVGSYGTVLPVPDGFEADGFFSRSDATVEVLRLYPRGTPQEALEKPELLGSHRAIIVEVFPKNARERGERDFLSTMEAPNREMMRSQGFEFSSARRANYALPALAFEIRKPYRLRRVYLDGRETYYKLIAGLDDPNAERVLKNLRERPAAAP